MSTKDIYQTLADIETQKTERPHSEYPGYTRDSWEEEVVAGDTQLGYWDWVYHSVERDGIKSEDGQRPAPSDPVEVLQRMADDMTEKAIRQAMERFAAAHPQKCKVDVQIRKVQGQKLPVLFIIPYPSPQDVEPLTEGVELQVPTFDVEQARKYALLTAQIAREHGFEVIGMAYIRPEGEWAYARAGLTFKVYGLRHKDGGEYAPICEVRDEKTAALISAAQELEIVAKCLLAMDDSYQQTRKLFLQHGWNEQHEAPSEFVARLAREALKKATPRPK